MTRGPTTKTINSNTTVLSVRIKCGKCSKTANYKRERITFIGHEFQSEYMSGGSVEANVTCMFCKQNLTIEVESW